MATLEVDKNLFTDQAEKSHENKINSKMKSDNFRKKRSITLNYETEMANKGRFREGVKRNDNFPGGYFY